MANMETLKSTIIDEIMRINDKIYLREIRDFVNRKKVLSNNMNTVDEQKSIPSIEIKLGVSLAAIRKNQDIDKLNFTAIQSMFKDETWEQSLEELLASID